MSEQDVFKPPRSIKIDNYYYTYKDALVKDYSYRCKHRRICGVLISITEKELKLYNENNEHKIKYTISSTLKTHNCIKNEDNKSKENEKKKKKNVNKNYLLNKEFINSLIYSNSQKPLSFHKNNLKANNIFLSNNQIKWLLQKIRDEKFPSDALFLEDISNIKITFDKEPNLQDINFCEK